MFTKHRFHEVWLPVLLLAVLYIAAIMFRPLLPVDETRYMTVAWEMHLRGDWLAPLTVNFHPYHHKPPLLFWLINAAWLVFGVSRWAGTLPILVSAIAFVFISKKLASMLFPEKQSVSQNTPMIILGSIPFLIYSLMVMFDLTLAVFVLLSLIALISFAKTGKLHYLLWLALAMGLGVLTKGPVAWLYVVFPIAFGPLWTPEKMPALKWYGGCVLATFLSVVPVLLWLVPVLSQSTGKFAYWLVWEQTAGRVTGNFNEAHVRPFWFYLPLLPVLCLPWLFFPSFWQGVKNIRNSYRLHWAVRFILLWIIPVFIAFSLISGKQPHYLVPLLPGVLVLVAFWWQASFKKISLVSISMILVTFMGQGVASQTLFKQYDLQPIVQFIKRHENKDWAFVRKYQGELSFVGRLEKQIYDENMETIDQWFIDHPQGLAIIRFNQKDDLDRLNKLFEMPYRGKYLGVFEKEKQ